MRDFGSPVLCERCKSREYEYRAPVVHMLLCEECYVAWEEGEERPNDYAAGYAAARERDALKAEVERLRALLRECSRLEMPSELGERIDATLGGGEEKG